MLVADHITKRFSGIAALDDVCLELPAGKVTAIIGENGAGKSTLMKILSGVYPDYDGRILYNGKEVRFANPRQAQNAGIVIIHQELNLIPHLSVAENIFLGRELNTSLGFLDKKAMRQKTRALLDRLKLRVDADALITDLKVGQQQVVEIAKALLTDAEVIIMDEPTSAISESEVEVLFDIIESLRSEGKAIAYISHKLDELFRIADRYIVLRDGKVIESGDMAGMTHDAIIRKMVGRDIHIIRKQQTETSAHALLSVSNLCLQHPARPASKLLKDISFSLAKGEILGIFGLMGAGRTELLESLFGMHAAATTGTVSIAAQSVKSAKPADAIRAGLALVPEDRKKDGLVLGMEVKRNISLTTLRRQEAWGLLHFGRERLLARKYIGELAIKTPSETSAVKNLSGGNQQKVVLAKWLATNPKILMLDEPTRGIDVNAKNEIYRLIIELADKGLGVIVVSSELPELLSLADRILVMAEGVITASFPIAEATEGKILKAAIPRTI